MSKYQIPPIEKIHEAFSAIADGRVTLLENRAFVKSSDYAKEYTITWDGTIYVSNDNSSFYVGYIGYPILAVLMLQGKLKYTAEIASHFSGINWKKLNTKHKNDYAKVVSLILDDLKASGIDIDAINEEVDRIYAQVKTLNLDYKKSGILPPK